MRSGLLLSVDSDANAIVVTDKQMAIAMSTDNIFFIIQLLDIFVLMGTFEAVRFNIENTVTS